MDAVFGTGIGFGQPDGTAFSAGAPFVQIKREFDAVAAHIVDVGVGAVLRRGYPCGQCSGDMGARGGAFGTVGELGRDGGKGMAVGGIATTAEVGFFQQGRLNFGFVGGFGMEPPVLLFAQ